MHLKEISKYSIQIKIENSQGVAVYISEYDYYVEFGEFLEKIAPMEKSIVLILDEIRS